MTYTNARHDEFGGILANRGDLTLSAAGGSDIYNELLELEAAGQITIAAYVPPTQAEIDAAQQAEIDRLTAEIDTGRSILRALGVEVYLLAKAAEPSLNPTKFKQRIRDRIAGF